MRTFVKKSEIQSLVPEPLAERHFPGFRSVAIRTPSVMIAALVAGNGPPLLLLHGYPENRLAWRNIAPELAKPYTVVVPDLRGYGDSEKPDGGEGHVNYSKRVMAIDQVEIMEALGFERFSVAGHDRGARVAHRLALDHPDRIEKLAVLDILPTDYMYRTVDRQFATTYYHWFLLIQPAPLPEILIGNSTEAFMRNTAGMGTLVPELIPRGVFDDYLRCMKDPRTIHGMCEEYRASATIDLAHDEASANQTVACPVLVLWGAKGLMELRYDSRTIWAQYATNVVSKSLPCGHWIPEEVPELVVSELLSFLS
jgi:haloacetate dehalogenase